MPLSFSTDPNTLLMEVLYHENFFVQVFSTTNVDQRLRFLRREFQKHIDALHAKACR